MRIGDAAGKGLATTFIFSLWMLAQGNPYQSISERNVFGLKPPAVYKPVAPEPPPRPVPNLLLTGVVDFSTLKWALITRTDAGRPPTNHTLTLGEHEGGLELLELNATKATVTVRVDGMDTVVLQLPRTNQMPASATPPQISGVRGPALPLRR